MPLDRVAAGLDVVDQVLAERALDPDPDRGDWAQVEGRVLLLENKVRNELLGPLEEACQALGDAEQAAGLRAAVAHRLASAAAVLHASGNTGGAADFLAQAVRLAPSGELRDVAGAGRGDPVPFVRFQRALWLRAQGRHREAERLLRALSDSPQQTIQQAARAVLSLPRPLSKAPTLFQFNGCGTSLFGRSASREDGSHVATYFLTLVWVPVLPLTAFRVRKLEDSRWQFLGREKLATWARVWQGLLAAALLCVGAWYGSRAYLESPARLARVATAEAAELETSGRDAEALQRYHEVIGRYGASADVRAAAGGMLRLSARSVKEPCTPEQVGAVTRVVTAFEKLPAPIRQGELAGFLLDRLEAWAGQIGDRDPRAARAALLVLASAEQVAEGPRKAATHEKRLALELALADRLASERPLDAIRHYVQAGGTRAQGAVGDLLVQLGDDHALWAEAAPDVEAWLRQVGPAHPRAAEVRATLDGSGAEIEREQGIVAQAEPAALAAQWRANPRDQILAVAVARDLRARGDAEGCLRALDPPRGAGWLTGEGQGQRAACLMDLERFDEGAALLEAYLDDHLPVFQRSRREYDEARESTAERLVAQARAGNLPADVNKRLESAPEKEQGEIFRAWLSETLDKDTRLASLGNEFLRHRAVVPACLTLGMLELRRSQRLSGDLRQARLAAAERAFLAIRDEAEGAPQFHLALGMVYHRLGKTEDGEKELGRLLSRNEPDLTLEVADAYRELGNETRTREILEKLYAATSDVALRQRVAFQRAHAQRDLEDQDLWLRRSDPTSSIVRAMQAENDGHRDLLAGRDEKADKAFRSAAEVYGRDERHSSAAANNAALALLGRYAATGDARYRHEALTRLESALRLSPESKIVHGNLADALEDAAVVESLGGLVHLRTLRPSGSDGAGLFSMLVQGPHREELLGALRAHPSFRRARSVTEQEQVLAPRAPGWALRLSRWHRWTEDAGGLRALAARLDETPLELGTLRANREEWRAGKNDARLKDRSLQERDLARTRVARARTEGHAPTIASALALLGTAEEQLAVLEGTAAGPDRAVTAFREAVGLWPGAGFEEELAGSLLLSAAAHAAESSPEWRARYTAGRRVLSVSWMLLEASSDPKGGPALAAVRSRPELTEALALRSARSAQRPEVGHLVLARALGDTALERSAEAVAARATVRPELKLALLFEPDGVEERGRLQLFDGLKQPDATPAKAP